MKITVRLSRSTAEPELLAKFVIQRCQKVTEPPPVLVALALAMVSRDHDFYDRLKDLISSSSDAADILRMCHEVFLPALGRVPDTASPDGSDRSEEYPFPDERNCQQVLRYALREGKRMLASRDYEYIKVLEFLMQAGLQPYAVRLYQFEAIRQSFQDDPENLVRKGLEIIKVATYKPRKKK